MGVSFTVYDTDGNFFGEYTTNEQGLIFLEETFMPGKYILYETATRPGYILDTMPRTVTLEAGEMVTIIWENQPVPVEVPKLPKTGVWM